MHLQPPQSSVRECQTAGPDGIERAVVVIAPSSEAAQEGSSGTNTHTRSSIDVQAQVTDTAALAVERRGCTWARHVRILRRVET